MRASARGSEFVEAREVALHAMLAHWGFFQFRLGKGEQAYNILSTSAAYLRSAAEPLAAIYSQMYLGIDCWILRKFLEAKESFEASRALAKEYGESWYEAMDTEFLGMVAIEQGEYTQARQYLTEAVATHGRVGDPSMTAHALSYLGRTLRLLGEYREAEKLFNERLFLSREIGYRVAAGLALDGLGELAYSEQRYEEARSFFSESVSLFQEMGDTHRLSRTLNHRGLTSIAFGDSTGAQYDFRAALNMAYEGGWIPTVLYALTGLGNFQ